MPSGGYRPGWTHAEYIARLQAAHGNTLQVLEPYVNTGTKIRHVCSKGHVFSSVPRDVLRNHGCGVCNAKNVKFTHDEYLGKLMEAGSPIEPLEDYKGNGILIKHRCTCGNEWPVTPNNVLVKGVHCGLCNGRTHSKIALRWLETESKRQGVFIQHAGNGKEKYLRLLDGRKVAVDGFAKSINTVFEFYGDYYHGNPRVFKSHEQCHPYSTATAGELYQKTMKRECALVKLGYEVVSMWEADYKALK